MKLREIGATNKVHPIDYENAVNEKTAGFMKVHPSNFKIIGFTEEVSIEKLVELGKKHDLPVIDDIGAGAFADISKYGYDPEPLVADSIKAGADIVCSSGDKLVGGVQAGIIVGKKDWIARIRKHPLYRALRCDKITLAALHATLQLFLDIDTVTEKNPTWRMLAMTQEQALSTAEKFALEINQKIPNLSTEVICGFSELGSGSLPGMQIPTGIMAVNSDKISTEKLANELRANEKPIFTRIENEKVLFDVRTMQPGDFEIISKALQNILHKNEL